MDEVMAHGGLLIAEMLKREGVEVVFTLSGGHVAAIYDGCLRRGIRVMDTRHEQVAVHAAEGWAKVTRQPGVALLTAGPGVTDGITGIANAYQAGSPILVFGGAAPIANWDQGALQELRHLDLVGSITKWARTVTQTSRLAEYTAAAFREATAGRPGPVFLECPMDVLNALIPTAEATIPGPGYRTASKPQGDPAAVERAAALLAHAERPVIFAGTAVWWDDAAAPLRALAERLNAPVFLNGGGRGSLPPDHPLYYSLARRTALGGADLLLLVGTKLDFRLNYGQPPLVPAAAKIVWLDTLGEDIGVNRGADVGIAGDVGAILRQLDAALAKPVDHSAWVAQVRAAEAKAREAEEALMRSDATPIHPMRLCRELRDALDHDAYVVGDGGDIVSYGARVLQAWEPGHWLDAGPMGTLGAGTGFAIAAKLARPDKQVAILFGDGAFGLNGMEFETMVRHNLPIVGVIGNDGQWAQIKHPQKAMLGHSTAADLTPGIRYDRMVEALGGYGELVTRPEEIRPAIERAFASGRPACVNVLTDPNVIYNRTTQVAV
ncbi:MAG: acetolactate synthase [Ktedonobacterales bacterium]|jgi:acetolactate synthase-1/2/3 large subunit|nr:MAG: acetolactate synthase [Ktedonobacterales bacterium]